MCAHKCWCSNNVRATTAIHNSNAPAFHTHTHIQNSQTKWKNVYVIRSDEMRFLRYTNIVFFCQIDIKCAHCRFASMHFCAFDIQTSSPYQLFFARIRERKRKERESEREIGDVSISFKLNVSHSIFLSGFLFSFYLLPFLPLSLTLFPPP